MIGLQRNANAAQEFICLMDIADKKQALLRRAGENGLKAQLASDPRVKQTFLDLPRRIVARRMIWKYFFFAREGTRRIARDQKKHLRH
jgi:hypothetical protein